MEPIETLKRQIYIVHALDDQAWQALYSCFSEVKYKRKQLITKEGEVEKYLYFVVDGIQRAFFEHSGKDATLVFSYSPSFSGIIDSFFVQQPSRFALETLTPSTLLRLHYNDLVQLMEKHRSIESWVRIAIMQTLAGTLERQKELLAYTAEEKFTTLLRRSPQVLNLIPHKYLASYIGVDPATFSKLLSTVRL